MRRAPIRFLQRAASEYRSDRSRVGYDVSNVVSWPSTIPVCSKSRPTHIAPTRHSSYTRTVKRAGDRMPSQHAFSSPAVMGIWTISPGAGSSTVDLQNAWEHSGSSNAALLCRPRTCGSGAIDAMRHAHWFTRSERKLRITFPLAGDVILIWIPTTTLVRNIRAQCFSERPTAGFRSRYRCWRFRWKAINCPSCWRTDGNISRTWNLSTRSGWSSRH